MTPAPRSDRMSWTYIPAWCFMPDSDTGPLSLTTICVRPAIATANGLINAGTHFRSWLTDPLGIRHITLTTAEITELP
jgi:hypothetical protein